MKYWLFGCCLVLTVTVFAQETNDNQLFYNERQVWAFYLSFWAGESTWDWNESVLTDYPLIGKYNSKMPDVAAIHIAQAQAAGIDAFVVSWFGLRENVTTTPALLNMLHRAEEMDFQIVVVVDVFNHSFNRNVYDMLEALLWLREYIIPSQAYLRYQGQPVIVFAFQDSAGWSDQIWWELRNRADPNRDMIWIAEGLSGCCLYGGAMDGMYAFNMAWASGNSDFYQSEQNLIFQRGGTIYVPSISPGWNEDTIAALENRRQPTSPRDRANGEFLVNAWNGALETESNIIMIVSWNEFMENSHIEPSQVFGRQSLDILHPLITNWKGTFPPASLIPAGYVLQVDKLIPAFSQPDRNSEVIAILQPDTPYQVISEESGLYAVLVEGLIAYVSFEHVRFVPQW